jgi:hypothetical protein
VNLLPEVVEYESDAAELCERLNNINEAVHKLYLAYKALPGPRKSRMERVAYLAYNRQWRSELNWLLDLCDEIQYALHEAGFEGYGPLAGDDQGEDQGDSGEARREATNV